MSRSCAVTRLAVLVALLFSGPSPARGQAWVQPEGGHYWKLSALRLASDREFNHRGDRRPLFAEDPARSDVGYRELSLSFYGELGVSPGLTLAGATALANVRTRERIRFIAGTEPVPAIRTNYGLADTWIWLRRSLTRGRFATAVQSGLKMPSGYDASPGNDGAPLGTARVDFETTLGGGVSLPRGAYAACGLGYRVRGGDRNDQVLFHGESGLTRGRLFAKARLEGIRSTIRPPDIAGAVVETPVTGGVLNQVVVGDHDVLKLNLETSAALVGGFSLSGEMTRTLAGKNTLHGTTWGLSIVHQGGGR